MENHHVLIGKFTRNGHVPVRYVSHYQAGYVAIYVERILHLDTVVLVVINSWNVVLVFITNVLYDIDHSAILIVIYLVIWLVYG